MRFRGLALALLVLPAVYAAIPERAAVAQDDARTTEARRRFQEGVKLFDAKKYPEARAAFLQAVALRPHPAIVLNLGETELLLQMWPSAVARFEEYLQMEGTTESGRTAAQKSLATAKLRLAPTATPEPAPPSSAAAAPAAAPESTLVLRSTRPGTAFELRRDGTSTALCAAPCEAKVPSGTVTLQTSAPGQVGGDLTLTVVPGERRMVSAKPGAQTVRYVGWGLIGAGALGLVVSLLRTESNPALTAGSAAVGLAGGATVFLTRTEINHAPAGSAYLLRFHGRFLEPDRSLARSGPAGFVPGDARTGRPRKPF